MLFSFELVGGGDVKLLAATALWAGPDHMLVFLVGAAGAGGIVALVFLFRRIRVPGDLWSIPDRTDDPSAALATPMPYGIAIAFGGLIVAMRLLGMV